MNNDKFKTLEKEDQRKMLTIFGDELSYARSLPERLWEKTDNTQWNKNPIDGVTRKESLWKQELQ